MFVCFAGVAKLYTTRILVFPSWYATRVVYPIIQVGNGSFTLCNESFFCSKLNYQLAARYPFLVYAIIGEMRRVSHPLVFVTLVC